MLVLRHLVLPACLALAACGGSDAPAQVKAPPPAKAVATPKPASLPPGQLARAEVDAVVLRNGPPWILTRVGVEEVLRDGKFVGWRILSMPKEWSSIDLKPGDVVTRVNGMTIEKPEELWTAWTSLVVASDLRVAYERDTAPREVIFHIDGEPAKEVPQALRDDAAPARPPPDTAVKKGRTVVIVGDDSSFGDGGD